MQSREERVVWGWEIFRWACGLSLTALDVTQMTAGRARERQRDINRDGMCYGFASLIDDL